MEMLWYRDLTSSTSTRNTHALQWKSLYKPNTVLQHCEEMLGAQYEAMNLGGTGTIACPPSLRPPMIVFGSVRSLGKHRFLHYTFTVRDYSK